MEWNQQILQFLSQCFLDTLSPLPEPRRRAESSLSDAVDTPNYGLAVLRLLAEPAVDEAIRQAAAVNFKNLLKSRCVATPPSSHIPDPEKEQIKTLSHFYTFYGFFASLLAALGSIQFVSIIAFAYFVLNKTVTVKVLVATAFIVLGNIFLVFFGNHQSPVYTPEQLAEKFSNIAFLLYCIILVLVVAMHHSIYGKGESLISVHGNDLKSYWHMLLPFSYAIVSGAVGSCSVLFAKSLSNLLRLSMSSDYELHSWFTYSMLLLFLSTAGFWMARLNEGLSLFDALLIVPMFQIAWTFFSIYTGFVYFQEYQGKKSEKESPQIKFIHLYPSFFSVCF